MQKIAIFFFLFCLGVINAQYYFSKNKVQYQDFSFKTYPTEHFIIYFYDGGENLVSYASNYAEELYKKLSTDLQFEIKGKIPIIIYNSPNQFQQTNIVLDIIEESVGGFSELFKNRVVLPFNGSYKDFRQVIEHELVHIFEFEMFYRSRLASVLTLVSEFQVPLWILEGFSEYVSNESQLDVGSEIFLRDLVLNNRFVPLNKLTDELGYINYRLGEAFYHYVAEKYDRKKIFEFLHTLKSKRNLESAFKSSFNMSLAQFSEKFEEHLKIKYWPLIIKNENFTNISRLLTNHIKDGSIYNTAPAISPSGTKIAFISDRNGYADIYVISAIDGKPLKHLVKGERSGGLESMHLFKGSIAWSNDEKFIVFVTKSKGKDYIVMVEYPSGKIKKRISYNLDGINSVNISRDNQNICFIGLKNGYADIYIANLKTGKLIRVTYDYYEDRDPAFTPDGKNIIFVSDRPSFGKWQIGAYGLFQVTVDNLLNESKNQDSKNFSQTLQITPITNVNRMQYLACPTITFDNKHLIFVGSDSAYNLYIYSIDEQKITHKTDFNGGVYYPSVSNDNDKIVFSYYQNYGWDIAVITEPLKTVPQIDTQHIAISQTDGESFDSMEIDQNKIKPYQFSLSPDYAVGQAYFSTNSGVAGQLNISLSDALGNHRFYLVTDLYQDIANSEILFNYWYLPKRTDWALVLFQYFEYPVVFSDYIHLRRNRGLGVLASYPIDKFTRLELANINYFSYNEIYRRFFDRWYLWDSYREKIFLIDEAFVFDNTVWNSWGAFKGTRMRLESYQTVPFSNRRFYTTYLDFRNYFRISPRYNFATLIYGLGSFGADRELFAIGGENVRGYEYGEFNNHPSSKLILTSLELRHPLIDKFKLAYPIPLELNNIRGVTFLDCGITLNDSLVIYKKGYGFQDLKMGIGAGIRIRISYFLLKLDFAKPLSATENKNWKFYFSLGTDF
ncbi:MAG: BamA/TamA family outer membrane protein [candidate division WOR-3 bacterium]